MKKKELKAALDLERANNDILMHYLAATMDELFGMWAGADVPEMDEIILNNPAVVVKWADGTKTVSKARGGDEWDPLFGIIACTVRKLTDNHGHGVDDNESLIAEMAKDIQSLDDIDYMMDFCVLTLDILTVLRDSKDLWYGKLGPDEDDFFEASPVIDDRAVTIEHAIDKSSELEDRIDQLVREREEMRQKVRDLIDAGEL